MIKALLIYGLFLMHPVHVTLTSIEYNPDPTGYNVFVRLYFDDFVSDNRIGGYVISEADYMAGNEESRKSAERYLAEKLEIRVDGKLLSGRISELQLLNNELSMNLFYRGGKKVNALSVKNMIMTGLYADMSNMVIVRVKDYEEGVKLSSDVTEQVFGIK
jgi:hypothetical protein